MTKHARLMFVSLLSVAALGLGVSSGAEVFSRPGPSNRLTTGPGLARNVAFSQARIYIEYNSSANDLGFHIFLDAEDWETVEIRDPAGVTIFEVEGTGGYAGLGLTELFFEGAEPNLDDFPLEELLDRFPEGRYRFIGRTVEGDNLVARPVLSHAVPAGPIVSALVVGGAVTLRWQPVTEPADILPDEDVDIVGYQVIVGSFQVTLPSDSTEVTLPQGLVESLRPGVHPFEVLAIESSGNQSITEGTFEID